VVEDRARVGREGGVNECCGEMIYSEAPSSACSLSHRERGGVRGYSLSIVPNPLTPPLLPCGEREQTEFAAASVFLRRYFAPFM
jgi:hypothetical protein